MKRNAIVYMVLMASTVLFFGYLTTPVAIETPATIEVTEPDYRIVDSKAMATGMSAAPKWYEAAMDSTSTLKALYPDSVPVLVNGDGENLEAVKFQLETFAANQELSGRLSTYIDEIAGQTITSDGNEAITRALSSFTAVASKTEFSGLAKEADYWILREFKDGQRVYTYTVLYLIPEDLYDAQLDAILNEIPDEGKEVIQPLIDMGLTWQKKTLVMHIKSCG